MTESPNAGNGTVRRSSHFVPGANERMLNKSLATDADSLVLDLEDAVTPDNKDSARATLAGWLADVDFGAKERVVRINPLDSPWCTADIAETMVCPPDAYLVPKVNNAAEVVQLDEMITRWELEHGHPPGGVVLLVLGTETPQGLINIGELARHDRVDALSWGAEDLSAAMGSKANRDAEGAYLPVFEYARVMCLVGATAWGKQPLDTVFVDFRDDEGLAAECATSAAMGFTGKITIHPAQIDIVNAAFTPSAEELADARELLEAFTEAEAAGLMAFAHKGPMVDVPHLTRARKIVATAEAISERS
ncbi:HpcH/HpaI aldolase/citrate lyase family protein [Candidatus Poriferisodalis sp.]|uniref:HpcH/HpaI aldolase/citrate lyase family protein n=1 Tax=Candidatus Poriferisodalis sp. TaxID=3101277 RepID=UPI003B58E6FA